MRADELRERNAEELKGELKRNREELMKARFAKASNQLKNQAEVRAKRRNIARIMTILKEKNANG